MKTKLFKFAREVLKFLFIVAVSFMAWKGCETFWSREKGEEPITPEAVLLVDADVKNINKEIDEKGLEHAIFDDLENVIRNKSQLHDSAKIWYDSAQNLIGIVNAKDKYIAELTTINYSLKEDLLKATKTDSGYRYEDEFLKIEFVKKNDSEGFSYFNYRYDGELSFAHIREKPSIFRRGKGLIDVWLNDPRGSIDGIKRVRIADKPVKTTIQMAPFTSFSYRSKEFFNETGLELSLKKQHFTTSYRVSKPLQSNFFDRNVGIHHSIQFSVPLIFLER